MGYVNFADLASAVDVKVPVIPGRRVSDSVSVDASNGRVKVSGRVSKLPAGARVAKRVPAARVKDAASRVADARRAAAAHSRRLGAKRKVSDSHEREFLAWVDEFASDGSGSWREDILDAILQFIFDELMSNKERYDFDAAIDAGNPAAGDDYDLLEALEVYAEMAPAHKLEAVIDHFSKMRNSSESFAARKKAVDAIVESGVRVYVYPMYSGFMPNQLGLEEVFKLVPNDDPYSASDRAVEAYTEDNRLIGRYGFDALYTEDGQRIDSVVAHLGVDAAVEDSASARRHPAGRLVRDSRLRRAAIRRRVADAAAKSGWGPLQGDTGREGFTKHYDAPVESIDITKKGDKWVMYINPASILSKDLKDYLNQYYASTEQEAKKRADAIARHLISLHKELKDGHVKDDAKCDGAKKAGTKKTAVAKVAAKKQVVADAAAKSGEDSLQGDADREDYTKYYIDPYVLASSDGSSLYYGKNGKLTKNLNDAQLFEDYFHASTFAKRMDIAKSFPPKLKSRLVSKASVVSDAYKAALARVRKVRDSKKADAAPTDKSAAEKEVGEAAGKQEANKSARAAGSKDVKVTDAASKLWWLGFRSNPQLKSGGYYVAYGQISKKDAKAHEGGVYGGMSMKSYSTQEEYDKAIEEAKNQGYRVQRG